MTQSPAVEAAWRSHRPYLVNLAYQMLGDVGEAEDVAQEAFLRLSRADVDAIDDVRGWLTVVAGRLCLDQLRSSRTRHERPDGMERADMASTEPDPADRVTLDDEVRAAMLEVLRRLSPGERVSFVLHDIFGMPFGEIAAAVGRPVGTCRQLARRARGKFADAAPRLADVAASEHQLVTERFITACANGDLDALTAVLDPAVWGVATLLSGKAPRSQRSEGRDAVGRRLIRYLGRGATLVSGSVSEPVVFAFRDRRLFAVLVLTLRQGRVHKIEATVDPRP
ncbi:RNA polymerase subunit sigma [Mycolicibacterium agri]|uniref:Putative alternative RNA polymerase SigI n=1 Tax=Mycolicibacterium agri TaxID=36811 RepID=A0A2A7MT59_MYCAG|nr:RNA polymerase sigma factor SigI [Mycolicibacterium agri]PEG34531.1 RNA polymerase subunit sigma [Mycolicibacterium agri]GFG49728.1 putative alternative RNA polymerase SigI [Mycolicibacterium agri]